MRADRWYEVFPGGIEHRGSRLRFWLRSSHREVALRASHRWSRRTVAEKVHPLTLTEANDNAYRRKLVEDFINGLLLPSDTIGSIGFSDPSFQKNFARLWAFLTAQTVRGVNGEQIPRKTSTVSVYMGPGGPQAFLNDRACGRCLAVTADTFQGLWGALEDALAAEVVQWRHLDSWTPEKKTTSRKHRG